MVNSMTGELWEAVLDDAGAAWSEVVVGDDVVGQCVDESGLALLATDATPDDRDRMLYIE